MLKHFIIIFLLLLIHSSAFPQLFRFKDSQGDEYYLRSFSVQEVLINNVLSGIVDQKYEAKLKVLSKINKKAKISGKYFYYNKPYRSTRPYILQNVKHISTQFYRKENGRMDTPIRYLFPVVRHVPSFPDKDISVNEGWNSTGEEAQDLSKLGIKKPLILPFNVEYRYLKDETFRGRNCAIVEVVYTINMRYKMKRGYLPSFPSRVMGYFKGVYYWDKERGYPIYYKGDYDFIYALMNGRILEFRGIEYGDVKKNPAHPFITKRIPIRDNDPDKIKEDIEKLIKDDDLDFPVKKKKNKISINLGELLFDFDSAQLKNKTITKLDKLARLLMKYDHYIITVEGHTDSIGQANVNQKFSDKRATNVRDYLVQKGVSPKQIKYKGYGEKKPIDSNKTKGGRAKNRRVEIIIDLEKKQ